MGAPTTSGRSVFMGQRGCWPSVGPAGASSWAPRSWPPSPICPPSASPVSPKPGRRPCRPRRAPSGVTTMSGSDPARVLGLAETGARRQVSLSVVSGRQHTHVLGGTGSGKSTLLARLPEESLSRLVLIDPAETTAPPTLNVLDGADPEVAVDQVTGVFARIFSA